MPISKNPDQLRRELIQSAIDLESIVEGVRSVQWAYGGDNGIKLKTTREWQDFLRALRAIKRDGW